MSSSLIAGAGRCRCTIDYFDMYVIFVNDKEEFVVPRSCVCNVVASTPRLSHVDKMRPLVTRPPSPGEREK